jgi:ABC-type polysaccharide transport system permease subunit
MQHALKRQSISLFPKYIKLTSTDVFLCAFAYVNAGPLRQCFSNGGMQMVTWWYVKKVRNYFFPIINIQKR